MSQKNKIIFSLIALLFLVVGVYFYCTYHNQSPIDMNKVVSEIRVSSENLTASYTKNEKNANSIYKGKIIEVDGIVKEVTFLNNRNTVILYGNNKYSGVLCDMQSDQILEVKELKKGQKIKVKGVCKGFLKDAILLNCMLINQQSNE